MVPQVGAPTVVSIRRNSEFAVRMPGSRIHKWRHFWWKHKKSSKYFKKYKLWWFLYFIVKWQDIFLKNFQKTRNSRVFKTNTLHNPIRPVRFPKPVFIQPTVGQLCHTKWYIMTSWVSKFRLWRHQDRNYDVAGWFQSVDRGKRVEVTWNYMLLC